MRVVIAPDKFKGSLTAPDVADHLEAGLLTALPELDVVKAPMADGGEGTLDAAVGAGFTLHYTEVAGPTGEPIQAAVAIRGTEAVVEMAAASGLAVLPGGAPAPLEATSLGAGQLIRFCLDAGCRRIILGVGGSAGTDGGAGLLTGLGARMLDADGGELPGGGAALAGLHRIDLAGLNPRIAEVEIILASDVDIPLLGAAGAAAVFGPQKGATDDDVAELDAALARFALVLARNAGPAAVGHLNAPGAGAAGGVGYAAMAVLGAERRAGIDVVFELAGLGSLLADATLAITGEGSLDEQSLMGKTPLGVAQASAAAQVPVVAVCGRSGLESDQLEAAGFRRTYALTEFEPDIERCSSEAGPLLEWVGRTVGTALAAGQLAPLYPDRQLSSAVSSAQSHPASSDGRLIVNTEGQSA
ncbi:glycerate kinase [Arthrobacter castelli]|uniref:glycerate kinase n=1 Tax=Arthrobacter castelli TaxID=271431 RepID=UPI00041F8EC0|nr:glycerate kinase [Arthrobacter castelli]